MGPRQAQAGPKRVIRWILGPEHVTRTELDQARQKKKKKKNTKKKKKSRRRRRRRRPLKCTKIAFNSCKE